MSKTQKKIRELRFYGTRFPDFFESRGFTLAGEPLFHGDYYDFAEEMLWHYAAKLGTDAVGVPLFNKNFYSCLAPKLTPAQKKLSFPEDFQPLLLSMKEKQVAEKAAKDAYKKDPKNKEAIAEEAARNKELYDFATLNGEKQPLMKNQIEAPGIFMTHGDAPLFGMWKYRVRPEDVVINYIGPKDETPTPPAGHKWKEVTHNQVYYVVSYNVDIGHKDKHNKEVRFGNSSSVKAEADQKKFDKATNLLQHKSEMEAYIKDNLSNPDPKIAECALVSWLLQTTGIRIGNEKDTELEADTVGASTLKKENIWAENGILYLDFIGKSSVHYKNEIKVPKYIEAAITRKRKKIPAGGQVFVVNSNDVNKFLGKGLEGCTAKLWRTAIATGLLVEAFKEQKVKKSMTVAQKLHAFDKANLEVAKKLNHKRAVPKNHQEQVEKLNEDVATTEKKFAATQAKLEKEIIDLDKKIKKAKELGLDKNVKSFKEAKAKKQARLEREAGRLEKKKFSLEFKEDSAEISIGTSRTNYCSPKIAFSICKDLDIPISNIYSAPLLEKFKWAEKTGKDYWKKYPFVNEKGEKNEGSTGILGSETEEIHR